MSELDACAAIVRRNDRDRYLTCLFAGEPRRGHLFALYAFNHEVAKTAEVVSEPLLGEIRLQWWRERVDELYDGNIRRHEVVEPLAAAIHRCALTRAHFHQLVEGRAFDLDPAPPPSLKALEAYAEATSSSLLRLSLEILEVPTDGTLAKHLGIAWALTGLIRAVPFHAEQKRLYLPDALSWDHGLDRQALFELKPSAALAGVAADLAARANEHLEAGRAAALGLPRRALPVLLLARVAAEELKRLRRFGYDPFDKRLQAPSPGRIWRLAWASLISRS